MRKGNAGLLQPRLGPHQALAHRGGRDQEGGADTVQAVRPSTVWRIGGARMPRARSPGGRRRTSAPAADREWARAPPRRRDPSDFLGNQLQMLPPARRSAPAAAHRSAGAAPAVSSQASGLSGTPSTGHRRAPRRRLRQRVFGAGDIAGAGSEESNEPPVAFAGHSLGGNLRIAHRLPHHAMPPSAAKPALDSPSGRKASPLRRMRKRPHLDVAPDRAGTLGRPLLGRRHVGHVDDEVSAQLLAGST